MMNRTGTRDEPEMRPEGHGQGLEESEVAPAVPYRGPKTVFDEIVYCSDDSHRLRRMDVLLTRHRRALVSKIISVFTKCFWSHVATTYVVPDPDYHFHNAFIMESTGKGVDLHRAVKYLAEESPYDCAILRVKAPWFSKAEGSKDVRRRARGRLLDKIDGKYDRSKVVRGIIRFYRERMGRAIRIARFKNSREKMTKAFDGGLIPPVGKKDPVDFMCSGFVSHGLYEAALKEKNCRSKGLLDGVLVHPAFPEGYHSQFPGWLERELVLSTAPVDFARSDKFEWKWVVLKGVAHRIGDGTRDEANRIFQEVYEHDFLDWPVADFEPPRLFP